MPVTIGSNESCVSRRDWGPRYKRKGAKGGKLFYFSLAYSVSTQFIISPFPEDTGIYSISGSAWCFLAVETAFWLYLRRLLRNNPENCETPSQCQTLPSCLRATRATLWRRLKASFS